ncbi:MAG: DUF3987 domain-containing protein [Prevotella sp.]|nr:DUF3987 domain-containing protein [Prevotella sp.]
MLNYYKSFYSSKQKRWVPGVKALNLTRERWQGLTQDAMTATLIKEYREGEKEAKTKLPAVCWTGYTDEGNTRKIENMTPTGLYIIDIDHIQVQGDKGQGDKVREVWENILEKMPLNLVDAVRLVHITPSGAGLRIVMQCTENFPTLPEHMQWLNELVDFSLYGDFDTAVKDISRISFVPQACDILYESDLLWSDEGNYNPITTPSQPALQASLTQRGGRELQTTDGNLSPALGKECPQGEDGVRAGGESWKPLRSQFADYKYRGTLLTTIIDKYIEVYGEPEQGEKHNFYNKMVRDFRNICDNNPLVLHDLLPRFGGDNSVEYFNTLSQCQSICRSNTNGSIPREFFVFLAKNGFYKRRNGNWNGNGNFNGNGNGNWNGDIDEEDDDEVNVNVPAPVKTMPTPPPVIKELISICPEDFKVPCINALMPILGTLTSYVRTEDRTSPSGKTLSTSFFSIIYAPPASGKSFVDRYVKFLLRDLKKRDEINHARDLVFSRTQQKKSANDRSEAVPQTSVRIIPAKNSEAEFLEKQRNNKGHHMFTYCAELDEWRKGVRAAGGNKDDMIRIAWDNGEYGQQFKATNTFKGTVNLYWNVLLCGTQDQLEAYFKNVTNGLVTRCSFTEIENQEFQKNKPVWGKWTPAQIRVIERFLERCDEKTYQEPLNYNPQDCYAVKDEDFDKEVPWHYSFRPFENVSIEWAYRTVQKFLDEQCDRAMIDTDQARDTFRKRVGERGLRLALLCTQLYDKPMTTKDKELCKKWLLWWMRTDIESMLKPFGSKFIEAMQPQDTQNYRGKTILDRLGDDFTAGEVQRVAQILGFKQNPNKIIYYWVAAGVVEKFDKDHWRKVKKEEKNERKN